MIVIITFVIIYCCYSHITNVFKDLEHALSVKEVDNER